MVSAYGSASMYKPIPHHLRLPVAGLYLYHRLPELVAPTAQFVQPRLERYHPEQLERFQGRYAGLWMIFQVGDDCVVLGHVGSLYRFQDKD